MRNFSNRANRPVFSALGRTIDDGNTNYTTNGSVEQATPNAAVHTVGTRFDDYADPMRLG